MKKIGFVDYYISEWHANNYPAWMKATCEKLGLEYEVAYVWASKNVSEVDGKTTEEWCKEFGVEQCATAQELCAKSDCIVILAPSNPEQHLPLAKAVFPYAKGKRIYIDKTFAPDLVTAKEIYALAEQYDVTFFSTSALRYSTELDECGNVQTAIVTGGGGNMPEYIIHQVEMAVKMVGCDAVKVKVESQGRQDFCRIVFASNKEVTCVYSPAFPFAVSLVGTDNSVKYLAMQSDSFKGLMEAILNFFETGILPFEKEQTLAVMKIREGLIKAKDNLGEWITL